LLCHHEPVSEASSTTRRALGPGLLLVLAMLGALARLPGLNGAGLFFDDAWFALPARVPLSTALSMVVTAPGYTLVTREWILLAPHATAWAKVLPYLLGVAGIVLVGLLGRRLGFGWRSSLLMAGLVAAAPAAIEYSVRVKEYEADLVLACLVLLAAEVVRRTPSWRSASLLGLVSIGAVGMSTSTAVVVVGCWLAVAAGLVVDVRGRLAVAVVGALTALACAVPIAVVASRLPAALTRFWVRAGYLVGAPLTARHLVHVARAIPEGFVHSLLGVPLPTLDVATGTVATSGLVQVLAWGTVLLGLVVVGVALRSVGTAIADRADGAPLPATLGAILVLVVAVGATVVGIVPLGDGRTDLVLYPSIAVIVAVAARAVVAALDASVQRSTLRTTRSGVLVLLCGIGLLLLVTQASWYPAQDVAALPAAAAWRHDASVAVVVENRNAYTWAFDGLSAFDVHVDRHNPSGTTVGYWVTFPARRVLAETFVHRRLRSGRIVTVGELPGLERLPYSVDRLWWIGWTASVFSPSRARVTGRAALQVTPSAARRLLVEHGWHTTSRIERAPGVVAILYVR
jgi:hypothetical protein